MLFSRTESVRADFLKSGARKEVKAGTFRISREFIDRIKTHIIVRKHLQSEFCKIRGPKKKSIKIQHSVSDLSY